MKISQAFEALEISRATGIPIFFKGPPGCGKTGLHYDYVRKIGYDLLILDPPKTWDPVDGRGIPAAVNGRTTWLPPDYMEMNGKPTWILIDEMGIIPSTSQAFLNGLLYGRQLGGHPIPETARVSLTGNRMSDQAMVNRMPSHTGTRIDHIRLDVDLNDTCKWWLEHDIDTSVIAYNRFTGGVDLYPTYNSSDVVQKCGLCDAKLQAGELCTACTRNHDTFPNLRTWHFASQTLQAKPSTAIEFEMIAGLIGQAMAIKFIGYLKMYRQLPSLDSILLGPKVAPVPKDPAALYAVATALGRMATPNNLDSVCQYLNRVPPEFSVLTMRDATQRDKDLTNTRAFQVWGTKHADVLL